MAKVLPSSESYLYSVSVEESAPVPEVFVLPLHDFARWFVFVALLLGMTFAFSIATSIRFEDPCAMGGDLHCSIPECHCGTPHRRSGCREQPRYKTDICYPNEFRAYQRSGGDTFSWVLCAVASAFLVSTMVSFVTLRRKVMRLPLVPAQNVDAMVADDVRTLLARVTVGFGGVYVALVICFALSIFAGAVLARKRVDDFIRLPGVAQALLYVGMAMILFSMGFLAFIYKGRQRQ